MKVSAFYRKNRFNATGSDGPGSDFDGAQGDRIWKNTILFNETEFFSG
jgi:hypothetical protein